MWHISSSDEIERERKKGGDQGRRGRRRRRARKCRKNIVAEVVKKREMKKENTKKISMEKKAHE